MPDLLWALSRSLKIAVRADPAVAGTAPERLVAVLGDGTSGKMPDLLLGVSRSLELAVRGDPAVAGPAPGVSAPEFFRAAASMASRMWYPPHV